jgi:hypothetical protein
VGREPVSAGEAEVETPSIYCHHPRQPSLPLPPGKVDQPQTTAMATYFQSFRNSTMPKRLLRYVMTRLDLLDAEALDLENLDLAFGKNTVLEFRDVGVQIQVRNELIWLEGLWTGS